MIYHTQIVTAYCCLCEYKEVLDRVEVLNNTNFLKFPEGKPPSDGWTVLNGYYVCPSHDIKILISDSAEKFQKISGLECVEGRWEKRGGVDNGKAVGIK